MPPTFVSYAQNREDVVLWRALQSVEGGRYVDVGANEPRQDSVTRSFYDRGWSGITIEPVPEYLERHRAERPRDIQVQAAVTSQPVSEIVLHVIPDTGLSTLVDDISARHAGSGLAPVDVVVPAMTLDAVLEDAGWRGLDIHFRVVDVEGAERWALESVDLTVWRPWVLVIEATAPRTNDQTHLEWEDRVVAAGYEFCLFDGLSRFYVAKEHADRLKVALSHPACPLDEFETDQTVTLRQRCADLGREADELRAAALARWAVAAESRTANEALLQGEIEAMRATLSWRVTAPLRWVRGKLPS